MIERHKCKGYQISQKNKTIFVMCLLFTVSLFCILFMYYYYQEQVEMKDFVNNQLKQSNKIMSDRLLVSVYLDVENERLNDRYIEMMKKNIEKFNLTKYKSDYDFIYPVENPKKCFVAMSQAEYGYRILKGYGKNFHHGIDIKMVFGGEIICPKDGVVYDIGFHELAGNYIEIFHESDGREYMTVYFHLSRIDVLKGQDLKQGEVIGFVGDTGELAKGHVHLHYAAYKKTKNGWKSFNLFSNSLHGAYENKEMPIYNFLRE